MAQGNGYWVKLITMAETHSELDGVVMEYLESIDDFDQVVGETYEETAERLNDWILEVAADRLIEILETDGYFA